MIGPRGERGVFNSSLQPGQRGVGKGVGGEGVGLRLIGKRRGCPRGGGRVISEVTGE